MNIKIGLILIIIIINYVNSTALYYIDDVYYYKQDEPDISCISLNDTNIKNFDGKACKFNNEGINNITEESTLNNVIDNFIIKSCMCRGYNICSSSISNFTTIYRTIDVSNCQECNYCFNISDLDSFFIYLMGLFFVTQVSYLVVDFFIRRRSQNQLS